MIIFWGIFSCVFFIKMEFHSLQKIKFFKTNQLHKIYDVILMKPKNSASLYCHLIQSQQVEESKLPTEGLKLGGSLEENQKTTIGTFWTI